MWTIRLIIAGWSRGKRRSKLVELIYRETAGFPREETFGLTVQMRRSAISISSNIAEGAGRNSSGELIQFLGIASGSKAELDTHLEIAARLGLIQKTSDAFPQLERVGKLLVGLRRSLKQRSLRAQEQPTHRSGR